ncbi:MAG TPA: TIGR04211 family SH3 domain-containing protein [Nevskiaceae bacterium]|nr:TIGR04211 family SH3 domain-containing protein [Nevskiaceae bacterium]
MLLLLWLASAAAGAAEMRYVADNLSLPLRAEPQADAAVLGLVESGTAVEWLGGESATGYTRIRLAPGREGWVPLRHLSREPVARSQLGPLQQTLAEQQSQQAALARERDEARSRLALAEAEIQRLRNAAAAAAASPLPALAASSEAPAAVVAPPAPTAAVESLEPAAVESLEPIESLDALLPPAADPALSAYEAARLRREGWTTGALLLAAGVMLGLFLPHLTSRRSRRDWSEL